MGSTSTYKLLLPEGRTDGENGQGEAKRLKPHAVIIPFPLQGHIIPAVNLAIKLASYGFTVTFINTEAIHHRITSKAFEKHEDDDIFAGARGGSVDIDIRYETVSDGFPLDFDRSLNHDEFMMSLLHFFSANVEALFKRITERGPEINCLIADTFFVWPETIAKRFRLVHVTFWTEPALVFSLYCHIDMLRKNGHFGCEENRKDTIEYIPGVPSISPSDLTSYLQEPTPMTMSVVHQIIYKAFDSAKAADMILCNTIQELESLTISAFQSIKPFYAVGPIFSQNFAKRPVPTSLWPESNFTQWLNAKPKASVLFVSFGSYAHISRRDLEEIAMGILETHVSFVWVVRPDIVSSDDPNPLPPGFLEETQDRGIVVPWCCQTEVLRHESIGGFLTHCGWNSVLESIWCGVPMLCFPLLTDQFTNRKLVVDDWKVGVGIGKIGAVRKEDVGRTVVEVMRGELGFEIRRRIEDVKSLVESVVLPEGSSEKNFRRFIDDLVDLIGRRCDGGSKKESA